MDICFNVFLMIVKKCCYLMQSCIYRGWSHCQAIHQDFQPGNMAAPTSAEDSGVDTSAEDSLLHIDFGGGMTYLSTYIHPSIHIGIKAASSKRGRGSQDMAKSTFLLLPLKYGTFKRKKFSFKTVSWILPKLKACQEI